MSQGAGACIAPRLSQAFFDDYFGGKRLSVRNALFVCRHPWLPVLVSTGWDGQLQQVRVAAQLCAWRVIRLQWSFRGASAVRSRPLVDDDLE